MDHATGEVVNEDTAERQGLRWGRGDFGREDAEHLGLRLARRTGMQLAATLSLVAERGDAATAAFANEALAATRDLSPPARSALLTHPTVWFEISRLVEALSIAQSRGEPVTAEALIRDGFLRIVRGAALAAGGEAEWTSSARDVLPIIGLVVEVARGVRCRGRVAGDTVEIRWDGGGHASWPLIDATAGIRFATGRSAAGAALPSFRIGDHRIHVDAVDPAFIRGWIPRASFSGQGVLPPDATALPTWVEALEAAARVVERVLPETAGMVGTAVRSFVPVVSRDPSIACSMSDSMMPGAIMSTIDGPPVLAESIVHEFRHNLLHQLETAFPIYAEDSPQDAKFYSPWRNDPRPLHGILHALFVFLDVCAIHAGVREQGLGEESELHDSAVRLAGNVRRIRIALEEFRTHARLSPFGTGFVEGIERACDRFDPALADLSTEARQQAEMDVIEHRRRWRGS